MGLPHAHAPGRAVNIRDTIAAISTPPGRGGLGIVRLSGPQARAIAEDILRFKPGFEWKPWTAALAELVDDQDNIIDHVVVTFFAAPRSYTADDVVEISCHGSPVVLRHALERACAAGTRLAEPGEFTLRAFLNGRIDLPRAEAVRDAFTNAITDVPILKRPTGDRVSEHAPTLKSIAKALLNHC